MKTYTKIKEGEYEVSEIQENKYVMTIATIDKNLKFIATRIASLKQQIVEIEKQQVEQTKLKETLLKIK